MYKNRRLKIKKLLVKRFLKQQILASSKLKELADDNSV